MSEQNWENNSVQFIKRPIKEILDDAKTIDPVKVGNEILAWLVVNIENFVDSQTRIFKLDLILDNVEGMPETTKLQNLYRAIPDNDEMTEKELDKATKCRIMLDKITKSAHLHIKGAKEVLAAIFNKMIFYYEKMIISPENKRKALAIDEDLKKLIKQQEESKTDQEKNAIREQIVSKINEGKALVKFEELVGIVDISNFEYEAFDVNVKISEGQSDVMEGEERKVLHQYVVRESFTLWIEINYKNKQRPTNLF